jgi:hypothetical protein
VDSGSEASRKRPAIKGLQARIEYPGEIRHQGRPDGLMKG